MTEREELDFLRKFLVDNFEPVHEFEKDMKEGILAFKWTFDGGYQSLETTSADDQKVLEQIYIRAKQRLDAEAKLPEEREPQKRDIELER